MDNGMYNYGMQSPVMQGYNPYSYQGGVTHVTQRVNNNLPRYDIIRVNGKPGVDAFQMGPNSSVILVDETAPIVWFVRTDGAGYKEAKPFDISPHTEKPPVDVNEVDKEHSEAYSFWLYKKSTDFDINVIIGEQKDFC